MMKNRSSGTFKNASYILMQYSCVVEWSETRKTENMSKWMTYHRILFLFFKGLWNTFRYI